MILGTALLLSAGLLPPAVLEQRFAALHPENGQRAAIIRRLNQAPQLQAAQHHLRAARRILGDGVRHRALRSQPRPGGGAIVNWSGSALLPSLFESLRGERRHCTFVFMAFSDEERGLIGSREYVQGLSGAQRGKTVAAVNIDCIGLRGPRAS